MTKLLTRLFQAEPEITVPVNSKSTRIQVVSQTTGLKVSRKGSLAAKRAWVIRREKYGNNGIGKRKSRRYVSKQTSPVEAHLELAEVLKMLHSRGLLNIPAPVTAKPVEVISRSAPEQAEVFTRKPSKAARKTAKRSNKR